MAAKSSAAVGKGQGVKTEPQASPLAKKLTKILDTKLENDPGTLDALHALSEFFNENSLSNRRTLRGDMEKMSLRHNEEFCRALQQVRDQLEEIHKDVEAVAVCHQDMSERLKATRTVTSELISQTAQFRSDTKQLEMKSKVASNFLAKFQLSEEELSCLRGQPGRDIVPGFFAALQRVHVIHDDCKQLLRTSQQRLGLEIMERMSMHQEAAFERLYHWVLTQVHNLSFSDAPELPPLVRQGLLTLQGRPILFSHCISELSLSRRSSLVQAFIDALTRGGPGGTPRPIELFSHDALRYVGDIFGWLHQAMASERDFLLGIFGKVDDEIPTTLAQVTEGVCRPLRVRVEQVIMSDLACVTAFKLASLLRFYSAIFAEFLPEQASLTVVCREMCEFSMRVFISCLHTYTNQLLESVEEPPSDLVPTKGFKDALQLIQDILSNQDLTRVQSEQVQSDLPQIFQVTVDPLLHYCSESATKLTAPNMATYLINCIYTLHSTLSLYEFTEQWLEKLTAQQQAHIDTLADHQASTFLVAAGLAELYTLINRKGKNVKISEVREFGGKQSLGEVEQRLSSFLSAPDQHLLPQCVLLLSPTVRERVHKLSVDMLVRSYKLIYAVLQEDEALDSAQYLQEPLKVKELLS